MVCPGRPFGIVLGLAVVLQGGLGAIIPPQWANETLNPCARESWQLLHWPHDDTCYNIFTKGPCGETQEFYFDREQGRASCRCSRGSLWHPQSQRCHQSFSDGPCGRREYFAIVESSGEAGSSRPRGGCRSYEDCSPGHLFWPPEAKCFPHLSKGPCQHGQLLYVHPETGSTECGCHSEIMSTNYWKHRDSCHELFTTGPCVEGHVFVYNLTSGSTECVCGPHLFTNYHKQTDRCYQLDTVGPCRQGQVFTYDQVLSEAKCSCLPGYVEWLPTGACYRSYTRGPCLPGEFLRPHENKLQSGTCFKISCSQGELYDPDSEKCYPVGRRGPCSWGKLWIFERAASVRGSCHCDPLLIGYWGPHGVCYELGERGPCPKRKVLSYDKKSGRLRCRCDLHRGFVPWANGRCIKAGVRRTKLIPVAGPIRSIGGNSIEVGRVHRGLTLPQRQEDLGPNAPTLVQGEAPPRAQTLQEEILKDVLSNILNHTDSNAVREEATERVERVETQTEVQTEIHRITVSRSVTKRRQRSEVREGLRTRRVEEE